MTDPTDPAAEEPTQEVPLPEAPPAPAPPGAPVPPPQASKRPGGPSLGHVVLGAVLVLIGVGWLLEALDVANVPWRFLLPSALILVGLALTIGARTGRHGGLLAVGIVLTALVLLAGAIEVVADVPLAGGVGDNQQTPTGTVAASYRWGVGKSTLDLTAASNLAGKTVAASVVVGELVVIVPAGLPVVITAHAGLGEVNVPAAEGTAHAEGVDPSLECAGTIPYLQCAAGASHPELALELNLGVAVGKVTVQEGRVSR